VTRVFELKQRPSGVGVILVAADFAQVSSCIGICPPEAIARAKASWPGPATWIFPRHPSVPDWIVGQHSGIALRVSAHPVVRNLCLAFGGALVSTSANRHNQPPALSMNAVQEAFPEIGDRIVPGALGGLERPTPIRDAITGEILRN
jgi:L-threonylcarbamoyladenylate synthase